MLVLLFYGYATGVFSSRTPEKMTRGAVRLITGNQYPDHDAIAAFRKRFLVGLQDLSVQILHAAHCRV